MEVIPTATQTQYQPSLPFYAVAWKKIRLFLPYLMATLIMVWQWLQMNKAQLANRQTGSFFIVSLQQLQISLLLAGIVVLIADYLILIPPLLYIIIFALIGVITITISLVRRMQGKQIQSWVWSCWGGLAIGISLFASCQWFALTNTITESILWWWLCLSGIGIALLNPWLLGFSSILATVWSYFSFLYGELLWLNLIILIVNAIYLFTIQWRQGLATLTLFNFTLFVLLSIYSLFNPDYYPLHLTVELFYFTLWLLTVWHGVAGLLCPHKRITINRFCYTVWTILLIALSTEAGWQFFAALPSQPVNTFSYFQIYGGLFSILLLVGLMLLKQQRHQSPQPSYIGVHLAFFAMTLGVLMSLTLLNSESYRLFGVLGCQLLLFIFGCCFLFSAKTMTTLLFGIGISLISLILSISTLVLNNWPISLLLWLTAGVIGLGYKQFSRQHLSMAQTAGVVHAR